MCSHWLTLTAYDGTNRHDNHIVGARSSSLLINTDKKVVDNSHVDHTSSHFSTPPATGLQLQKQSSDTIHTGSTKRKQASITNNIDELNSINPHSKKSTMYQHNSHNKKSLSSLVATSSQHKDHLTSTPFAYTEHGTTN